VQQRLSESDSAEGEDVQMTEKLYLNDTYLFSTDARVVRVDVDQGHVHLDRTIFHPQGGGQPSDVGTMTFRVSPQEGGEEEGRVVVLQVSSVTANKEGEVIHNVSSQDLALLVPGETIVELHVDEEKRILYSKLHSAGHALDRAMTMASYGTDKLAPSKGYHFEDAPYVEYLIVPPFEPTSEELNALPLILTEHMHALILEAIPTTVSIMSKEEAALVCTGMDLTHYPDQGLRVVNLASQAIPCGGTHVANTSEIGTRLVVTKIKKKKNTLRVSYSL